MEKREHLYNFVVNNDNLESLEVELGRFNPFRVLKIEDLEIRHSNVLAWLLNPKGNHNLGDKILKKIIMQVMLENEDIAPHEFDLQEIQLADLNDAIVTREKDNIDILAVSERNKLVLLIENKIYSKESKKQLEKYYSIVKREHPQFKILPVFLTLHGDMPIGWNYCVLEYDSVFKILNNIAELYKEYMPQKIYDFINFYLQILREALQMDDDKLTKLCKDIYKEHKEALDMIFSIIRIDDSAFGPSKEQFLTVNPDTSLTWDGSDALWFLPKALSKIPKVGNPSWNDGYPVGLWFKKNSDAIGFIVEVGPFDVAEQRVEFMKHLEKFGFKIKGVAKTLDSKYSRIFSKYLKVNDWSNQEQILELMNDLYRDKGKDAVRNLIKAVATFSWKQP